MCMKKLESTQNKLLPKFARSNFFGGKNKGGGEVAKGPKTTEDFYNEMKTDYGPLPSLKIGSSVDRLDSKYTSVTPMQRDGGEQRSLFNPYG